ncbi:hypothetical protein MKW94_022984 [Papaver nudicaule]|uniref:Pentatricopeptide repeat-containing protein n=1 Tax=Papaver nudicaule TaxID=74823 RepID=A0AA41V818_PAPNU|nr:hypothetical protein [Papaver nudicaule]
MLIRALQYVQSASSSRSFSSNALVEAIKHVEIGILSGNYQEHIHRRGFSSPCAGNMCTVAFISTSTKKGLTTSAFEAFSKLEIFGDSKEGNGSCTIQEKDYLRESQNSKAGLYILDLIDQGSIKPGYTLYNKLLKKCTQLGKLREGRMVHEHFLKSKLNFDLFTLNTIINMYTKCGNLDDAKKIFDEMPCRDMVTWTALITGYSQNGRPEEALALFPQMIKVGLEPNQFTFASLLKASGSAATDKPGRQVHGFVVKCGYSSDVYVASSLVDTYARFDRIKEAQLVFDRMLRKNEVSWNALIAFYARKGEGGDALKMFWRMQSEGFKPTHFTYASVFKACASTESLEQGKWVHAHMLKSGGKLIAFAGNTLLDMYAKAGSIEDARKIFDRLENRDVVSWNSMLTGFAQHGQAREAAERFEEMLKIGVLPNFITFLCVLTACSHGGLVNEGLYYYELMKKYNVEPHVDHYVTKVDLLGRAGLLNEAVDVIKEMPIEPTSAIWGALLSACSMHKNTELGIFAGERCIELNPTDSGPHMILSNIYASVGRLSDVARVRKRMREIGLKKEPGISWVKTGNTDHVFVANDDAHPLNVEIRKMWGKVSEKIKQAGYVPDTSHVLVFTDQQEREARLQVHRS